MKTHRSALCRSAGRTLFVLILAVWALLTPTAWAQGGGCGSDPVGGCSSSGPAMPDTFDDPYFAGNPINLASGNKYQRETDMPALPGPLGLEVVRHYNSQSRFVSELGAGWRLSYDTFVVEDSAVVQVALADGSRRIFSKDDQRPGLCTSASAADGRIEIQGSGRGRHYLWTWPNGRVLRFDAQGLLEEIRAADGRRVTLQRSLTGQLLKVTDPEGRELSISYGTTPQWRGIVAIRTPVGVFSYRHSTEQHRAGVLLEVQRPDKARRLYHYEDTRWPQALTGISVGRDDKVTRLSTYRYDPSSGKAIFSAKQDGSEAVSVEYPETASITGRPGRTLVRDGQGRTTTYLHQVLGNRYVPLEAKGPGCALCGDVNRWFVRDAAKRTRDEVRLDPKTGQAVEGVRTVADELGRTVEQRRLIFNGERVVRDTPIATMAYEGSSPFPSRIERPSVVAGQLAVVDLVYNQHGQPVRVTERGWRPAVRHGGAPELLERTTSYQYETHRGISRLQSIDGPLAGPQDTTHFEYDDSGPQRGGRLRTKVLPGGLRVQYSYDALGRVASERGIDGVLREYRYDAAGRLQAVLRSAIGNGDKRTESEWLWHDDQGRVRQVLYATGQRLFLDYHPAGQIRSIADPQNNRIEFEFNGAGALVARVLRNPDGSVAQRIVAPSAEMEAAEQIGGLNDNPFASLQQALSQLADSRWAVSLPWERVNQAVDGVALARRLQQAGVRQAEDAVVDHRGLTTLYRYDDFGRTVATDSPDAGRTIYLHDQADRVVRRVGNSGASTSYAFDAAGRLAGWSNADGATRIEWGPAGKPSRLLEADGAQQRFVHDPFGRLVEHGRTLPGGSGLQEYVTRYRYDSRGLLLAKTLPDGQELQYHYYGSAHPKAGVLREIRRKDLWGSTTVVSGLNGDGDRYTDRRMTLADGSIDRIALDAQGRLIYAGSQRFGESFDYGETSSDLPASAKGPGGTRSFSYDNRSRLTGFARTDNGRPLDEARRSFDDNGNLAYRWSKSNGAVTELRYAVSLTSNAIGSAHSPSGSVDWIGHDSDGAVVETATRRYVWNAEKQLKEVHSRDPGTGQERLLAEYRYNTFGQRIQKVVHSATGTKVTYFLYDGAQLSAEVDGKGELLAQYVYVGHRPVARLQGKEVQAVHSNQLGAPVAVTTRDADVLWQARYDAWGTATVTVHRVDMNLRAAGQYADAETGLVYNHHRYLDTTVGRYLSPDPLLLAAGPNPRLHADAQPHLKIDAAGLEPSTPVSQWTFAEKFSAVIERAVKLKDADGKLVVAEEMKQALLALIEPSSIALNVAVMAVWGALNLTPVGWVANAALITFMVYEYGRAGFEFIKSTIRLVHGLNAATCPENLDDLARAAAPVLASAGVGIVEGTFGRGKAAAKIVQEHAPSVGTGKTLDKADLDKVKMVDGPGRFRRSLWNDVCRKYEHQATRSACIGWIGELEAADILQRKGYRPIAGTANAHNYADPADFQLGMTKQRGQNAIDGVFVRDVQGPDGKTTKQYVLVESKSTDKSWGSAKPDTRGGLPVTESGRQLSDGWLKKHISDQEKLYKETGGTDGLSPDDATALRAGIENPASNTVTRILSRTDENGTFFYRIRPDGEKNVYVEPTSIPL
ncbi:DUF6531 domain-containing protein [Aquabacterium sp. A7-Y]|uniref:DUF6531 domain-containing protein n=1 Tax=Aquabacterium sp. A7-Y TaxID=1349605 RepID=UPI00223CEA8E|nr:DUF6531 domain-containing protein [Aquabacterium sp. A7-Y]MCW7540697.1 DUF6531 domain-containing protein [Aquabacterium sp. A7-Y]